MMIPLTLLAVYCCEWGFYYYLGSDSFWYLLLCSKQFSLALVLQTVYALAASQDLKYRSVVAFLCCTAWADVVLNFAWVLFDIRTNSIAPGAVFFCLWFLFVAFRSYDAPRVEINNDNVMLLLLTPRDFKDIVKSFLGLPVASVCILAGGSVWSFRTDYKKFCKTKFTPRWLESHTVIDTGVPVSSDILEALKKLVGTKRGLGIVCVYTIRNILKMLGTPWAPRSFIRYVPGFYLMQIIRIGNGSKGK